MPKLHHRVLRPWQPLALLACLGLLFLLAAAALAAASVPAAVPRAVPQGDESHERANTQPSHAPSSPDNATSLLAVTLVGNVFEDENGNGIQDGGEAGLPGVTLTLHSAQAITSTVTDPSGAYTFTRGTAGLYTIAESDLPGYRSTTPNTVTLNLAQGESVVLNFGDVSAENGDGFATIYGVVFMDANSDGVQAPGEAGLAGVTITLDSLVTTTTNIYGRYTFSTTQPGAHSLVQTDLPGYRSTTPNAIVLDAALGQSTRVDFGDVLPGGFASIYGTVFDDINGNGIHNDGEPGIAHTLITLNGVITTSTDINGRYTLSTTLPGPYTVVESDRDGYRSTLPDVVMINVQLGNSYQVDFGDTLVSAGNAFASFYGTVFNDSNRNLVQDAGETGIADVVITLDGLATKTNLNGGYGLSTTLAGWYTVIETDLPGYLSTTPNTRTLEAQLGIGYLVNFGDLPPAGFATLYGQVFSDTNNNGLQDDGETGLGGVIISLDGALGITATTSLTGAYHLTTTVTGVHTLIETDLPGFRSTTPNTATLEVALGREYCIDFGDVPDELASFATLHGTVFHDKNNNGRLDTGEVGLAGVTVTLDSLITTTTDLYGRYVLSTTEPGWHAVAETDPPAYLSTTPNRFILPNVSLGKSWRIDFGDRPAPTAALIVGAVFEDHNSNGLQDLGEPGLPDVLVNLDGAQGITTSTNLAGRYVLTATQAGFHTVSEIDTAGYRSTLPNEVTLEIALGNYYEANFGDVLAYTHNDMASIYGTVYHDKNNNMVQDLDETGLAGVTITLDSALVLNSSMTTTTNLNGAYALSTTVEGKHTLIEIDPPDYRSTTPNTALLDDVYLGGSFQQDFGDVWSPAIKFATLAGLVFADTNTNGRQDSGEEGIGGVSITLDGITTTTTGPTGTYQLTTTAAGLHSLVETDPADHHSTTPNMLVVSATLDQRQEANFGDVLASASADVVVIYGTVFHDTNNNGVWNAGEPGIPGVTITLDSQVATTTGPYGQYTLSTPNAGVHTLVETVPDGYHPNTNVMVVQQMARGQSYTVDFGLLPGVWAASIAGIVFHDLDGDGTQAAGEPGIEGALVTLSGASSVTSTTDVNGSYLLTTTKSGFHTVIETGPLGYRPTMPSMVSLNLKPGDGYRLNFGEVMTTNVGFASLYGAVFNDADGDGLQGASETYLAGVSVGLDGERTSTSDDYGRYVFSTTQPGPHAIVETDPEGYRSTTPNNATISVTLGQGYWLNFGDVRLTAGFASIHGTVFHDRDGDGQQSGSEEGIPGVIVTLDGPQGISTTSGVYGGYIFFTTVAGVYTVTETNPAGFRSTTPDSVALSVRQNESCELNFGDVSSDDGASFASIYGTVFEDADSDGRQDPGEKGISNVTVRLEGGAAATTNRHGIYALSTATGGLHTVIESDPGGYRSTTPNIVQLNVSLGNEHRVDFGDVRQSASAGFASLYGTVFDDRNGNGQQDTGETGIEGVSVTLDGVETSLTDLNGAYTFSTTVAGAHTLVETDPSGYRSTTPNSVRLDVAMGQSYRVDFGDVPASAGSGFATMYGVVFEDPNKNGVQDAGEGGLPNVTIQLDGGVTTTTDLYGIYALSTATSGTHVVAEIPPEGYFHTTQPSFELDVTLGESYQINFGNIPKAGYYFICLPVVMKNYP
ncbi:MAG: hypothetical protein JW850_08675 [Thermoflexales bacterium]|nr:hypothetical protein [Thermoflexales bacterium]